MSRSVEFVAMVDRAYAEGVLGMMAALYEEDEPAAAADVGKFPRTIEHLLTNPDRGRVMLFLEGAVLRGYAVLIPFWSNEFGGTVVFLDELYVMPEARGRGVGRGFLDWLAKERPFGAVASALETSRKNVRARRLYERFGFRERTNATLTLTFDG
jgi:GNAT superfamily N-acetyltransferase